MKLIIMSCFTVFLTFMSCNTEVPTKFSDAVLQDTFVTLDGDSKSLKTILEAHQGKTIFLDIWASWCGDCIKGMPKVKTLQSENPDVAFVFLSLDRAVNAWKRGIEKYDVQGEHYFLKSGKDSPFADFVDIDWIPRYMVVDAAGNIKLFKAVEADDDRIKANL